MPHQPSGREGPAQRPGVDAPAHAPVLREQDPHRGELAPQPPGAERQGCQGCRAAAEGSPPSFPPLQPHHQPQALQARRRRRRRVRRRLGHHPRRAVPVRRPQGPAGGDASPQAGCGARARPPASPFL